MSTLIKYTSTGRCCLKTIYKNSSNLFKLINLSYSTETLNSNTNLIDTNDPKFSDSARIYENFLSDNEEKTILNEIEPYLKRLRYAFDHWDDVNILF